MENNLILKNADIITMNPAQPCARAVAVQQGRIAAVGTEKDVRPYINGCPAIDLKGKTVLPGLIDSHRIEHFEIYDDRLVERTLQLNIHLGIQPPFNYHFGGHQRLDNLLGPQRALRSDPVGSLIDAGIQVGGGSDSYVTPMNPLYSIHCTANHSISAERLNTERALQLYTLDNARLAFEEKEKGSIEKGKQGDFTIVDGNPLKVPREAIKDINVDMTIIGGSIVYST